VKALTANREVVKVVVLDSVRFGTNSQNCTSILTAGVFLDLRNLPCRGARSLKTVTCVNRCPNRSDGFRNQRRTAGTPNPNADDVPVRMRSRDAHNSFSSHNLLVSRYRPNLGLVRTVVLGCITLGTSRDGVCC